MARRNESFFETIIETPWWMGISFAAILFLGSIIVPHFQITMFHIENGVAFLLKCLAALFALGGGISFIRTAVKGQLLDKTKDLADIKTLTWRDFEFLVSEYYRRKGYMVTEMGGASPDGGIDLIAQKNGAKLVIQCKHWKAYKVDVKIARELYGVMVDAAASGAVLITSGDFTQPTVDFVKDKPLELIDGPKLAKLISEVKAAAKPQTVPQKSRATLIPTEPPLTKENKDMAYMPPEMRAEVAAKEKAFAEANPACPHCHKPMVLRVAQRGATAGAKFWGCANYPACRHTMPFA